MTPPLTIHVLGVGNIGLLFAHSIAQSHGAQSVTLLFHRETLAKEWDAAGRETKLLWNGVLDKQKGYNFEILQAPQHAVASPPSDTDAIHNLIIATKATKTLAAFSTIRHRLTAESTILFCQNGMGILDEIEGKFPEASNSWPHYMAGIVTHGVYSTQPFHIVHAGRGKVTMGSLHIPDRVERPQPQPETLRYLPELLTRTAALAASHVPALRVLQAQLEKLVVNAIINPLTVLFSCRNGQLFRESDASAPAPDSIYDFATKLMHLLLGEICRVIQSLPEIQGLLGKEDIFSFGRMRDVVIDVATKTGANTSSMLQDFKTNQKTEIDYINGYIIRRGIQVGVDTGANARVFNLVAGGRQVSVEEIMEIFPELSASA
ncbi:ketopantoate reductase PanE/ApbA-domain-containing protein [Tirmania nivea]|nr:ketopantoate reductase PanE/ApbA-domain-containing protein [Tirmania nivea]